MTTNIPNEQILNKIFTIREVKVMLDADLAELYQVETKHLKRQVKRNTERFPPDFMFELTPKEIEILRCQIGTSSWGGTRYTPIVFTEQGVSMLSSVLNSPLAIQVNIQIIRIFTSMREFYMTNLLLLQKVGELEQKVDDHDERLIEVFNYLRAFLKENKEREPLGFKQKIG